MKKFIFVLGACASFAMSTSVFAAATPPPPPSVPTTVDECKKGGWETYGGLFKNQGDCVSFVVTNGRNQPDGPAAN